MTPALGSTFGGLGGERRWGWEVPFRRPRLCCAWMAGKGDPLKSTLNKDSCWVFLFGGVWVS